MVDPTTAYRRLLDAEATPLEEQAERIYAERYANHPEPTLTPREQRAAARAEELTPRQERAIGRAMPVPPSPFEQTLGQTYAGVPTTAGGAFAAMSREQHADPDPAMVELVRTAADATFGPHPTA